MDDGDLNLECAWALVDGLVAGGLRHACVSPGSRSTAIALALDRHPAVTMQVHLDERSAGFVATGIARASGAPVAIACTSGTAAAEYLPAVVEASRARLPLIVLTADRPPRLRGTGANQTIDQVGLYGRAVREGLDLPVPEAAGQQAWWRQAAREALEAAWGDPPGPVHVNCPFDEPLTPTPELSLPDPTGETLARPLRPEAELTSEETDRLAELVSGAEGAVVVGGWPEPDGATIGWANALGWPVLAEPISGARLPGTALAAGQSLIGDDGWISAHRPQVVVQLGATPTARATQRLVASAEHLVVADRRHPDPDPDRLATWRIAVDPEAIERAVVEVGTIQPAPAAWRAAWESCDASARAALDAFLDDVERPFEPRVARDVAALLPDGGTVFVGNSLPVRDLDLAMAPRAGLRVLANRGASGIDGLVSSAIGVAATTAPVVALIGDLSFLHDLGAVAWSAGRGVDLTVVVLANGGGEIFSALPQRELPEHRDLFVTPHGADLGALTRATGASHVFVDTAEGLATALDDPGAGRGLRVIEVAIDAAWSSDARASMRRAVARSLIG
jgi:2-succinyl-5-enolpyruvyl-6-hydroxy-3-cyclohexene-1-carboxylate synthase